MSYIPSIFFGGIIMGAFVLGITYRFVLMPIICWHFGEESRRDCAAIRRRREFQRRCYSALACAFFSGVAGVARGVVSALIPELAEIVLAVQIGLLLLAGLFAWAAVNRWREPFED
jgi:hypothetical protein